MTSIAYIEPRVADHILNYIDEAAFDLEASLIADDWNETDAVNVVINITGTVSVSMIIPELPAGSQVIINNHGTISCELEINTPSVIHNWGTMLSINKVVEAVVHCYGTITGGIA